MLSCRAVVVVLCLALVGGCNSDRVVGSSYLASGVVSAGSGGAVTVVSTEVPALVGTKITIPPGALAQDTEITIAPATKAAVPDGVQAAGPVAEFGPDGTTFAQPATMTLPFELPAGAAAEDLVVFALESDGTRLRIAHAHLSIDAAAKRVTFPVNGFTSFGCGIEGVECTVDSDCSDSSMDTSGQLACVAGKCVVREPDPEAECTVDADCSDAAIDPAPNGRLACVDAKCVYVPDEEVECTVSSDCKDDVIDPDPNARLECVAGNCVYVAKCTSDNDCTNGQRCNVESGACVVGQTGAVCTTDSQCSEGDGDRCVDGRCLSTTPPDKCEVDSDCGGGRCVDGACVP